MKVFICDKCGCKEEELYEVEDKKYCDHCLESLEIIKVHTIKSYCVNGEWFDEDEFYQALDYADIKVIK